MGNGFDDWSVPACFADIHYLDFPGIYSYYFAANHYVLPLPLEFPKTRHIRHVKLRFVGVGVIIDWLVNQLLVTAVVGFPETVVFLIEFAIVPALETTIGIH